MPRFLARIRRPTGVALTGALLCIALVLAGAVAVQAHRAVRAQRAAEQRVLSDHAAYAAAEFARRAAATLDAALVTIQHFPTQQAEQKPLSVPLPGVDAYASTVREQDHWCGCLHHAQGFFVLHLREGRLEATGGMDAATQGWVRAAVGAHAARIEQAPRDSVMSVAGTLEGPEGSKRYQLRIRRTTAIVRAHAGRAQALLFTVIFGADGRARAAYGLVQDPAAYAVPVFQRVMANGALLPASVLRGAAADSVLRVTVIGPTGAEVWRSGDTESAATASEPFPGAFQAFSARVELRPSAVPMLLRNELPASPMPLLLGLLATAAAVVGVAFFQMRRQHQLAELRADFVAGVSHELRTPLTQIRMFSELLLGGRLRTDEERERSLRLIDREARRLSYLVENVLEFSRGARSGARLSPRPVDVGATVEEIVDGFAPLAQARGMTVRVQAEPGVEAPLDVGAFRQILLNFLENAVKYGPAGQTVTVGAMGEAGCVRVWVDDGGPGIPEVRRERIWEPYYRLERDRQGAMGGSGIGLSVVRDLVGRHGGRAWVEDAPGGGARFIAEFRAAVAVEQPERSMAEAER